MPPKKPPPSSQSQKALTPVVPTAYERKPQPLPVLPDAASIPPLWTPTSTPKQLFPEWPSAAALATENWGSDDTPYEDPTPPIGFLATTSSVVWKRPSEFLSPITEPRPPALSPVVPDPKHATATKKAVPPPAKKGESEQSRKPKAVQYAHIVHVSTPEGNLNHHHPLHGIAAQPPSHLTAHTVDTKKHGASAATSSHPSTPVIGTLQPQPPPRRILHDFRRLWSTEQQDNMMLWRREEERIAREKEHRERLYMEFEDATAFIINGRQRMMNEDDVKAEDLEDDGEDNDELDDQDYAVDENSPYGGFVPPLAVEVVQNAVGKPEIPHGDVMHPTFASYLRIVDQLHQQWSASPLGSAVTHTPYLWEAIYPQDTHGVPMYNHAGKYSVRLYVAGKWRRIDVDDRLPIDEEGNIQIVSSSMKNELWPSILTKALIKVANWIGIEDGIHATSSSASSGVKSTGSIRLVSLVITALTSWKVTRLESMGVFAGNFQSLREFVPQSQPSDPQNEMTLDVTEEIQQLMPTGSVKMDEALTPRAIFCSTVADNPQNLAYQEASLLFDIVGDPGSVNLTTSTLDGPSSIKEEELSAEVAAFMVVHPPSHYADLLFESWDLDGNGIAEPFKNPPAQFCVVTSSVKAKPQTPGDALSEVKAPENDNLVNIVVTLCRIPPNSSTTMDDGNVNSGMAKHLGVDPRGSVLLVEDLELDTYRFRLSGQTAPKRRPLVFKIDTASSALLQLPRGEFESRAFRVYPQSTCRYGYSLLVESDVAKVDWQISSTYWRNIWDLQVIEADGAYPTMLPDSWNILFKQIIQLAPSGEDESNHHGVLSPELQVDLHVSDADLAASVHLYIVNQQGDQVISLPGVHGGTLIPDEATSYTLVVECRPRKLTPEGKWHLTLGSNRFFKHAAVHQPRLTIFSGLYVPNKPMVCFRDVVQNPKKTTSTSLQFELLGSDMRALPDLAASLQLVDLASGQPLTQQSGLGLARVLQLPPYTQSPDDPNEQKSGYIIQCGLDKSRCHVPTWLQSVCPFSNKQPDLPKAISIDEGQEVYESVAETNPHELRWRLLCWSVDEVKLEFDPTQELRFDAIRAGWADAAKDRDAHGASSRLLFLGKHEAAAAAMAEDSLSEDQMTKCKARAEWLHVARTLVDGLSEHDHIDVRPELSPDMEAVRQPEDLARDHERYLTSTNDTHSFLQSIREERATTKETRGVVLKNQLQVFIEQRKEAEKQRQILYTQRDEVRAGLEATAASSAGAVG